MSAPARPPEIPGLTYAGRLGSGGESEVLLYDRVEPPRLRLAVKVGYAWEMDAGRRHQFLAVTRLATSLADHPFIVPVYQAGTTDDGRPYIVMKHYAGGDLGERLKDGPLSVREVLKIGVQLASALEMLHRAEVVHGDVKPSNVLLGAYGEIGLTDFSMASITDETDGAVGISLPWTAPEMLRGQSNASRASDIYSLAATLWTLLTGSSPFETAPGGDNSTLALTQRVLKGASHLIGRLPGPADLERILLQAMATEPTVRPATALQFAEQLHKVEGGLGIPPTPIAVRDLSQRDPSVPSADRARTVENTVIKSPVRARTPDAGAAVTVTAVTVIRSPKRPDRSGAVASADDHATAYESMGSPEAVPLLEATLRDRERLLGPDHPSTLASRSDLAAAYRSLGQVERAIPLLEATLGAQERVLGPDHPSTLASRNNLAYAYWSVRRMDRVIALLEATIEAGNRLYGPDSIETLTARENLAEACVAAGQRETAISHYEALLHDCRRVLGAEHQLTEAVLDSLGFVHRHAIGK